MEIIKKFKDIELKIRTEKEEDIKDAVKFQDYANKLAEDDDAYLSFQKKKTLEEEKEYLKENWEKIKKSQGVGLIVEDGEKIVGKAGISLKEGTESHVAGLGIAVLKDYRGKGVGRYLLKEIIKLAQKEIAPRPEMIRLSVASANEVALSLYKKEGFEEIARVPKQVRYRIGTFDEVIMLKYL